MVGIFIAQKPANATNRGFLHPGELVVKRLPTQLLTEIRSHRDLHMNIHINFICDGQTLETAQMPIIWGNK